MSDQGSTAALWSALAATCSAIAALLSWRSHVRTYRQSFRPEIVISEWSRETDSGASFDVVGFRTIRNSGRGNAHQIIINATSTADDDRPLHSMSTLQIPTLAPGESVNVQSRIKIWWKNVSIGSFGNKSLFISIKMHYWDSVDVAYVTEFRIYVVKDTSRTSVSNEVARGVGLSMRHTTSIPIWRVRARAALSRLPVLGRRFGIWS